MSARPSVPMRLPMQQVNMAGQKNKGSRDCFKMITGVSFIAKLKISVC